MKSKKILITIMSLFALILMITIPNISLAVSTSLKTQIIQPRSDNMCYSIKDGTADAKTGKLKAGTKRIWNIVHVTNESPLQYDKVDHLYCMDAQRDGYKYPVDNSYSYVKTYNVKYDFKKDKSEILKKVFDGKSANTVSKNYHYLLGLYDIMYNPKDSKEKEYKKQLLESAGLKENDLQDGAISAVQQAALWYYTNQNDSFYTKVYDETKKNNNKFISLYTAKYEAGKTNLATIKYTKATDDLQTKFGKLYVYLIDTAKNIGDNIYKNKDVDVSNDNEYPVVVNKKNSTLTAIDDGYKYGPLKITKNNNLPYSLELSVKDGTDKLTYKLLNDKNEEIKDINKYTGDLYIKITTEDINKVNVNVTEKFQVSKVTVYHNTTENALQPISEFVKEDKTANFSFNANAPKEFDLALRKYITAVNGKKLENDYIRRLDNIDISKLANGDATTAIYKHTKKPVPVEEGNTITYTLKIYNEGQQAGRATQIVDQLPTGVELKTIGKVKSEKGNEYSIEYDKAANKVILTTEGTNDLKPFDDKTLDSDAIQIDCVVTAKQSTEKEQVLTNIAWISKEYNSEKKEEITNNKGADRDSEPSTTPKLDNGQEPTKDNMQDYHGNGKAKLDDSNYFYEGRQDDDDFEKLVIPQKLTGKYSVRVVKVDSKDKEPLEGAIFAVNGVDKTATDTKGITIIENEKVITKDGETIKYIIEEKSAPSGYEKFDGKIELTLVTKLSNGKYSIDVSKTKMTVFDKEGKEINNNIPVKIEKTEGLITLTVEDTKLDGNYGVKLVKQDENGENLKDPATFEVTNKQTGKTETKTTKDSKLDITNGVVQITEENVNKPDVYVIKETKAPDKYCEFNGIITLTVTKETVDGKYKVKSYDYQVTDKDGKDIKQTTGNTVNVEFKNGNIYVNVRNYQFDLALRKFIVKVNDTELKTTDGKEYLRAPVVDTSKLNTTDEKNNKITTAIYNHPKTPVEVKKGDTVIYMLRVYNEGDVDGYATEIKDHLPSYLEFVKGDFNTKYKWQVSEDGRTVTSTYLENQLITKATKNKDGKIVLSYKELPIMCKVKDTAKTQEAITNIADITKCKDKDKNDVTDRDSTPDNVKIPSDEELPKYKEDEKGQYVPGQEDDDDFEKVIVYQFDLALRKWVTQAIVIENGKETVTNTGHDAWDEPEDIVKVELHRKKLDNVTVKFKYSIRVYNQGDIEGYAKEITDYVPQGLKFVAEDNKGWTDEGNNVISTRLLENTLLKPGEYADVEVVLTWINGKDNVGLKVNTAEISEDYNDKGVPDIDSTPDNKVPGEDDIDDAPVLLSVETGREVMYIGLGFTILVTLAGGIILIKKYVL